MSHFNNTKDDLEQWAAMYAELDAEMIADDPADSQPEPDFNPQGIGNSQDTYWAYLDDQEDGLLQEDKTANPVYPDSKGPDHESPKPAWVNEDLLKEIEGLKEKMYNLECRMAEMGGGTKWQEKAQEPSFQKMHTEIESLKKRIEKASNTLGIDDSDSSPWEV